MKLTEIVMAGTLSLMSSCASQRNASQEPIPGEVIASFEKAREELNNMCNQPYAQERRAEGETPWDFGKRFCAKYGLGQYINPCGGNFHQISCLENNECMVLIGDIICDPTTDYCGKCD